MNISQLRKKLWSYDKYEVLTINGNNYKIYMIFKEEYMRIKPLYFAFINFLLVLVIWKLWDIGLVGNKSKIVETIGLLMSALYLIFLQGGGALLYCIYLHKKSYIIIIRCLIYTIIFDITLFIISQKLNTVNLVKYAIVNQSIGFILANIIKYITNSIKKEKVQF